MNIDIMRDFERFLYTKDLSGGTVRTYKTNVKKMEAYIIANFGVRFTLEEVGRLKGYMISNYATSIMEYKVSTRFAYLVAARTFLRYIYDMQYVERNLASALPPLPNIEKYNRLHPETVENKRAYTSEEIERLMDVDLNVAHKDFITKRLRAMVALLVMSGLRCSEMTALRVGDIRRGEKFAYVPRKGTHGHKEKVAISDSVHPYIEAYIEERRKRFLDVRDDEPLFVSTRGNSMTRGTVYQALQQAEIAAGLPTGVHTFRHTALTLIAKTSDAAVARDVAGQKQISVTNRYLHSTDDDLTRAVDTVGEIFRNIV